MKKIILFYFILSASTTAFASGNNADVNNYILQYRAIAVREMIEYGIPASITLAQGILESGSGKSELAKKSNNHFGIKCQSDWAGSKVYYDDDAANECFRSYNNPQESFHDHSLFLTTRNRYSELFTLEPSDYKGWAKGLKKAGYATNPKYAELLIGLIEDYKLYEYDGFTLADLNKLEKSDGTNKEYLKENPKEDIAIATTSVKFYFNRIPTVLVQKGDTPESIALANNIYLKRILTYNDIRINTELEPGTNIYLQPKRKKGSVKYHTVKTNETMWSISRDEGVELDRLYSYNLMNKGEEPAAGEILNLRKKRKEKVKLQSPAPKVDPEKSKEIKTKKVPLELAAPETEEMEFENYNQQTLDIDSSEEIIPEPPKTIQPEKIMHKVQSKETLYSISKMYEVTVADIQKWNKLNGNTISIGQQLIVGYK
ncbi:MAG: LysM peptidoglycan-binding domain-containing protein [Chitinophagales bacterium]|nr:LysM peptidoglycan-binding domain-containing protein [Chitinophagales bacterium]MBP8753148.1 LysM peptidoglycan-binding domain-containing protein [Chitinophagales bacterium]MBP9189137.1 LysM peptidoglycan-binding domain-containing protein [Chitinophagales bacterium]MBP9549381.1 LysM peptidoglycan-binding domain-containing protein [Chitinophagales bacterium]MBP9705498.1 LysM peptidoglycan-binding domain-containing protein [Chitinophagales bacterium]